MKFSKPQKMDIEIISPIFIGNGESLKPLSYIIEGSVVYVVDSDKFFQKLNDQERQSYLEWIEPILDHLSNLSAQIRQAKDNFDLRRELQRRRRQIETELSIATFIKTRLRENPVSYMHSRECIAYTVTCNTKPGADGFKTVIKDCQHRPYIPGTEIKGVLRTSLLYALLSSEANYEWLKKNLNNFRSFFRSGASPRKKIKMLKGIASEVEGKLLRGKKNDAKFDFLKLVHVSDSKPFSSEALRVETAQSFGTRRYTKTMVETICKDSQNSNSSLEISIVEKQQWVLKELGLERMAEWLTIPKLLKASYLRSKDILEEEKKYFAEHDNLLSFINELKQRNEPHSPLVRLGAGQGFLGVTVDLQVKRRDGQLYDEAIREGVSFQRRWRTQVGNFPKTRRVVIDGRGRLSNLLGWVKLSTDSTSSN